MKRTPKFLSDENGSMSLETVLVFPLLLWAFAATFLFWDLFHAKAITQRAAYTIADALSRETDPVDDTYINGMDNVHAYLIQGSHATRLRISAITWDEDDAEFKVSWSQTPDTDWSAHTNATLNALDTQIPVMAAGDCAILVEAQVRFVPFMNVGIPPLVLDSFIVTRPRFGPQLIWKAADGTETQCVTAAVT